MRSHAPRSRNVSVESLEARTLLASTNDPLFASQYALATTNTAAAWDVTRGKATVIVADIDTGADYTHRDLYRNVWINQSEIPSTYKARLRDTDGDGRISFYDLNASVNRALMTDVNRNGYIDAGDLLSPSGVGGWEDGVNGRNNANDVYTDDIIGWDFAENDNDPFDDGTANAGHGTHTAGIIGAQGNNGTGISGVAQKLSMMIVRIFTDGGSSTTASRIAQAIRYTADSGARAANASWGGVGGFNGDTIYSAIQYAGTKGQVFVTAAGNDGRNLDSSLFNSYPAEYALDNIITVTATTASGALASYSNYGTTQADVAAPGSSVLSTIPGNRYGYMSGTSMATPMVTGTIALMLSADKTLTVSQIRQRITNGADDSTALNNRTASDGELNVNNAVRNRAGATLSTAAVAGSSVGAAGDVLLGSLSPARLAWPFSAERVAPAA